MAEELADLQNEENAQVMAETPSTPDKPVIGKVEEPKRLSIREQLTKSFKEAQEPEKPKELKLEEKPRDPETGKFVKPVEAPKESAPAATPPDKGPPPGWSAESKAFYNSLPPDHPIKKDVLKREEEVSNGFKQKSDELKRYQEIEQVLSSARPVYQRTGVNDAEAIKRLFAWEAYIRQNPEQALHEIARQYGVNLTAQPSSPQGDIPQPVLDQFGQLRQAVSATQSEIQRLQDERIASDLRTFAKDHPYFERVRITMGQLMQAGVAPDLDNAYQKAVMLSPDIQAEINTANEAKKAEEEAKKQAELQRQQQQRAKAAVSPTSRAPSAAIKVPDKSPGIRGSILQAIEEVRGNGRA